MAEYFIQDTTLTGIANAIRSKTGGVDPIPVPEMAAQISGITTGGGSSEDVRYVTFLSYDGSQEYGKKAVAVGDDCADPIARGIFSTPTRESSVQYNYTFAGWAIVSGGGLDANALKAVNEDRTVYANFAAMTRFYTVSYYDGDTLLKTEQVAYGATPVLYTPEKEGYFFGGWVPEIATVTADATYTAAWEEKVTFANASFAKISEICDAGQAAEYFAVGDTKEFLGADGSTTYVLRIIGINLDYISSTKNAGITVCVTKPGNVTAAEAQKCYDLEGPSIWSYQSSNQYLNRWYTWDCYNYLQNTFKSKLPSDLQEVIKTVSKKTVSRYYQKSSSSLKEETDYQSTKIFMPSYLEVGGTWDLTGTERGFVYPGLDTNAERVLYDASGKSIGWAMRTGWSSTGVKYFGHLGTYVNGGGSIGANANYGFTNYAEYPNTTWNILPCFCI